ncbi:MAG: site-specific integrase [Bacteroidota bacterium]|nr:site-specific integrase [Bacteroidota bacterium]
MVYNLKAGEKTKNQYKSISISDLLKVIRGEKTAFSSAKFLQEGESSNGGKSLTGNTVNADLNVIDFFAFYDQQHVSRNYNNGIYKTIKNRLRKFHDSEGPLPIKDINKQWAKDWLKYLWTYKKNQKNNTVVLFFNHIRNILDEAVEQEYLPFNALWLVPKKERPKAKRSDADSLTFEEIQQLTNVKQPKIPREGQLMFLFSCFSGLRISDCLSLKWNQIYSIQDNGVKKHRIRVQQIKTKARVNKPLSDSALTILGQRKSDAEESEMKSHFVFPSYCPDRITHKSAISKINGQIKRWGTQAKLDHRMHFHLARHSYATMLLEQGNDITVVQQLLGHSDIRATMIYAHVSTGIKERAVNTLPKISFGSLKKKIEKPIPKPKKGQKKVASKNIKPKPKKK